MQRAFESAPTSTPRPLRFSQTLAFLLLWNRAARTCPCPAWIMRWIPPAIPSAKY